MNQIYRTIIAAIFSIFLCCAAGAQQTYTYTYNAVGDRTYKSGIGPEETAGRSAAAALSASGQGTAQARDTSGLSKIDARILEQNLINCYGLNNCSSFLGEIQY